MDRPYWQIPSISSDWDAPSIDECRSLTTLFGTAGELELPPLTYEQIVGMGDVSGFGDLESQGWLDGLTAETMEAVAVAGQRSLIAAGHVHLNPETADLEPSPQLKTLLAIRRAPAFLTFADGQDSGRPTMRSYGVCPPEGPAGALLEATLLPGLRQHLLADTEHAAAALARFLLAPPDEDDPYAIAVDGPARSAVRRRLEIIDLREPAAGRRYEVIATHTAGGLAEVDDDGASKEPRTVDHAALCELLTSSWELILTGVRP